MGESGRDILICAAVSQELAYLRNRLEGERVRKFPGMSDPVCHYGRIAGRRVRLLAGGIGMTHTAISLAAAVFHEAPAVMINTGCAGAWAASGLDTGDIGIATAEIDASLGLENFQGGSVPLPLPFPLLPSDPPPRTRDTRPGMFFLNPDLVRRCAHFLESAFPDTVSAADGGADLLSRNSSGSGVRVRTGPFLTVAEVTTTGRRAKTLLEAFSPIMESMEGAAAAAVAARFGIPFLEVRAASNLTGKRNRENWDLPLAFERAGRAVEWLIHSGIHTAEFTGK